MLKIILRILYFQKQLKNNQLTFSLFPLFLLDPIVASALLSFYAPYSYSCKINTSFLFVEIVLTFKCIGLHKYIYFAYLNYVNE